jgi:arginine/lysine/ornithine decarboxylase
MTPREALLARSEIISVEDAVGRVAASPTVACPPAIPIAVSGEEITENALRLFRFYGIKTVAVVK